MKPFFFSAMGKNDPMNLKDFSETVQLHFDGSFISSFADWKAAFEYIGNKTAAKRTLIIIDEFPFIAQENPSVKSILQHQIDKSWINKNIMLVLCGSNISYMEKDLMGETSPLYGRSTAQWEVKSLIIVMHQNFSQIIHQEISLLLTEYWEVFPVTLLNLIRNFQ